MDHLWRSWADNKREIYTIIRLSIPVSTGFLLNKLVSFVSVIIVGHLGPAELAAAALGSSLINVVGNSVLAGLAGAMSTLCGQVLLLARYIPRVHTQTVPELNVENVRHGLTSTVISNNAVVPSYIQTVGCFLKLVCCANAGVWGQKL